MNDDHAFFKLADYHLWDHVAEGADDSKIRVVDFVCEMTPFFPDFGFITLGFDGGGVRKRFFPAEDFDLVFELLLGRSVVGDYVEIGVVLVEFDCRGIGDPTRAEEENSVLSDNPEIVFIKISQHFNITMSAFI